MPNIVNSTGCLKIRVSRENDSIKRQPPPKPTLLIGERLKRTRKAERESEREREREKERERDSTIQSKQSRAT